MSTSESVISNSMPRDLLSLVQRIDVSFTKGHKRKEGRGSGFLLRLGMPPVEGLGAELNHWIESTVGAAPWAYVTCRHVVDYAYQKGEYGWSMSGFIAHHFDAHGTRSSPAEFPVGDLCVLVPKNGKLDLALVFANRTSKGYGYVDTPGKLITVQASDIRHAELMCHSMYWGTEVGFTSFQRWADGHPILRSGRVASDPTTDFTTKYIDKDGIYLLEALSFSGSSGAPVMAYPVGHPIFPDFSMSRGDGTSRRFEYREPHLLGIVSGHIEHGGGGMLDQVHVGLSYCHKASVLRRLISTEDLERLQL